jgi:hypothetical protein
VGTRKKDKVMSVGHEGQKNGQKQRRPVPLTCQHEQRFQIMGVNHAAHGCSAEEEFRELVRCPFRELVSGKLLVHRPEISCHKHLAPKKKVRKGRHARLAVCARPVVPPD